MRQRRPEQAARRGFELIGLTRCRGGERRVRLVVDDGLPGRTEARELDALHVVPCQVGEGQDRRDVLIQRRGANDIGDPFAGQVRDGLDARIRRDADAEIAVAIGRQKQANRLRSPIRAAEFEHTLLREIGCADARRGELDAALAQGNLTRNVVASGQHAQVDAQFVLQRAADGDRLVVAARTDIIGGPGKLAGQFDILRRRLTRSGENAKNAGRDRGAGTQ